MNSLDVFTNLDNQFFFTQIFSVSAVEKENKLLKLIAPKLFFSQFTSQKKK